MSRRILAIVLPLLLGLTVFTGVVSSRKVGRQLDAEQVCTAVAEGRTREALVLSDGFFGADESGRTVAECRCRALQDTGREGECTALLEQVLLEPAAADWSPLPDLAALVVRARRTAGDHEGAARLARRVAIGNAEDPAIHQLEIATRSRLEGETAVLEDLERRLATSEGLSLGVRLALAVSHTRRQDPARVAAVLGENPPPPGHGYLAFWFQARAWALAGLGDLPGLQRTYDEWRARGGDPHAIAADYALQLSIAQLRDPEHSWVDLLEAALGHESELADPRVPAALYQRWIGHLLAAGESEAALALYDRAASRYELVGITREQIVQGRAVETLGEAAVTTPGTLVFRLGVGAPAGTLRISPGAGREPDHAYESHPLAPGGELRVARPVAVTPQRWVFQDASGRTLASGSAWSAPGEETRVEIEAGLPQAPLRYERALRAGDGRQRVFVLLADCGDWRLLQYLRTRGELPVMDALLAEGFRAVLSSDPPVTAAAMEKLVWPERGRDVSYLGELNRLGLELAGLSSVGKNPLGFLSAVLPEGESLFEAIGAGPYVTANLLFSHGAIDAGRHAMLIGPGGRERPGPGLEAWRELTEAEAQEWPDAESERAREHARTIAAEMDAAIAIARAGEVDLTFLRIEPLDLLTHELFGELASTRQDDGRSGLLDAYRYLDRRTGELWDALDADDVLIVMSDHGARTVMEHSEDAVFVAVGAGIRPGRAPGRPELAGVPRALAGLFGVETRWPDTGVAASWETATDEDRVAQDAR